MSVNSKMTAIADAIRNLLDISEIMGLDAMANNISSITKRGAVAGTISEKSEQYIIPSGYHNGSGTVEISPDEQSKIIAENIKNGVTILGVAGSASGEIYAVIAVTYPEGSVCTCSNGTKTLKSRDTSGKALFNVSTGTWTVTAKTTDGSKEKSVDVTITAAGQVESVSLSYKIYLYNKGDECTDITGGWVGKNVGTYYGIGTFTKNPNSATASIVKMQSIFACTNNKISLTDANTIHANILSVDNTVQDKIATILAIATELNGDHTAIAGLSNGQTGDVSIDVSNITGDHYLYFYIASELYSASITFDEVYME